MFMLTIRWDLKHFLNAPWLHLVSYGMTITDVITSYFFKECQHLRAMTYW